MALAAPSTGHGFLRSLSCLRSWSAGQRLGRAGGLARPRTDGLADEREAYGGGKNGEEDHDREGLAPRRNEHRGLRRLDRLNHDALASRDSGCALLVIDEPDEHARHLISQCHGIGLILRLAEYGDQRCRIARVRLKR